MSPFWIWFLVILGGLLFLGGGIWWLIQRSRKKKKKKPPKKELPDKFYTRGNFYLQAIGLVVAIFFGVWGVVQSCHQVKGETKSNESDSVTRQQADITPSRIDTETLEIQKEKEAKGPIQVSDTSTLRARDPKLDSTCAIIYLEGDSASERDAQALKNFLMSGERKSRFQQYPFRYYPLEPKDVKWFRRNKILAKGRGETNSMATVYYGDPTTDWNARRVYYAATEGKSGVVFTEMYSVHQYYPPDKTNEGNGVLKDILIEGFGCEPANENDEKLSGYYYVLIIPPYYLNEYACDSLLQILHPPQE